jgi:hypothetical protein
MLVVEKISRMVEDVPRDPGMPYRPTRERPTRRTFIMSMMIFISARMLRTSFMTSRSMSRRK